MWVIDMALALGLAIVARQLFEIARQVFVLKGRVEVSPRTFLFVSALCGVAAVRLAVDAVYGLPGSRVSITGSDNLVVQARGRP